MAISKKVLREQQVQLMPAAYVTFQLATQTILSKIEWVGMITPYLVMLAFCIFKPFRESLFFKKRFVLLLVLVTSFYTVVPALLMKINSDLEIKPENWYLIAFAACLIVVKMFYRKGILEQVGWHIKLRTE